jgi:hypothetical protein
MFTVMRREGMERVYKNPHWESAGLESETFCTEGQHIPIDQQVLTPNYRCNYLHAAHLTVHPY